MSLRVPGGSSLSGRLLVLGAGYAGLRLVHTVHRLGRGRIPIVLVDRHPVHVLRTELYEIGRLAAGPEATRLFALPLARVLAGAEVTYHEGDVERIDLDRREVVVSGEALPFGQLAVCLGNVASYYGVPGAQEHTHTVYRLRSALRLATTLRELERSSATWSEDRRPRVAVVGGGSTGTEVAAEIATVRWTKIAGRGARTPEVTLVTGAMPFLAGLPEPLTRHARILLDRAGVSLVEGVNVARVEPGRLTLSGGRRFPFDVGVWAAGVEAPTVVRDLPVPHGRGGRVRVTPSLELPGWPGVFGVGDVVEYEDPATGVLVPASAQAAVAEAKVAGRNAVARWRGEEVRPFQYRERGVIVSVGYGAASGVTRHLTLWGAPAKLLKRAVEREYSIAAERGQWPIVTR